MHGFLNQSLDDGTSEGNPIYDEIIAATSGHTVDIEATSYLTALAEIGYAAAGMIVSYTLDQQPYPSNSISVTTGDGSIVHKDNSNGWSYNASTNVLTFHGDAISELGETVIITYEVEGTCQNDSE